MFLVAIFYEFHSRPLTHCPSAFYGVRFLFETLGGIQQGSVFRSSSLNNPR